MGTHTPRHSSHVCNRSNQNAKSNLKCIAQLQGQQNCIIIMMMPASIWRGSPSQFGATSPKPNDWTRAFEMYTMLVTHLVS